MELFSILCDTCAARLKVRQVNAIGQKLACPKCQNMLTVLPPDSWTPPPELADQISKRVDAAKQKLGDFEFGDIDDLLNKIDPDQHPTAANPTRPQPTPKKKTAARAPAVPPKPKQTAQPPVTLPAQQRPNQPRPNQPQPTAPPNNPQAKGGQAKGTGAPGAAPTGQWTSAETAKRKKMLLIAISFIAGIILVGAVSVAVYINQGNSVAKQTPNPDGTGSLDPETGSGGDETATSPDTDTTPLVDDTEPGTPEDTGTPLIDDAPPLIDDAPPMIDDTPPPIDDAATDTTPPDDPPVNSETNSDQTPEDAPKDPITGNPLGGTPLGGPDQSPAIELPLDDTNQITQRNLIDIGNATDIPDLGKLDELLNSSETTILEMRDLAEANRESEMIGMPKYFVRKTELKPVKADRQLSLNVSGIKADDIPLIYVLRELQVLGLPFWIDTDSWSRAGIAFDSRISVNLQDLTFDALIEELVAPLGLTHEFDEALGCIVIRAKGAGEAAEREFQIPNSIPDERLAPFATKLKALISPASWTLEQDAPTLGINGHTAIVNAGPTIQSSMKRLFTKLSQVETYNANPTDENLLALQNQWDTASETFAQAPDLQVTVDLPLHAFLTQFQQKTGTVVLADWSNLLAEGWNPQTEVPGNLIEPTTEDVLRELARGMQLTFHVVDENTIELTTFEAALGKLDVEVYPCKKLIEKGITPQELEDFIFFNLLQRQTQTPGVRITFEQDLQCFIAVAPQSLQRQIGSITKRLLAAE